MPTKNAQATSRADAPPCDARTLADGAEGLAHMAADVLRAVHKLGWSIATAESCTGGLLASLLTDIEGLSGCFERGFVVYSIESKVEQLGLQRIEIERHGIVSQETALAMAEGALANSHADLAVAITGFAGSAGVREEAGLVHIAAQLRDGHVIHRECHFGAAGRDRTRHLAARAALEMMGALAQA